jgi:hypothetical protein
MKREGRGKKDPAAVAFIFAKGKFAKVIPIKKKNATVAKLQTFMESVIPNLKSQISNITWYYPHIYMKNPTLFTAIILTAHRA